MKENVRLQDIATVAGVTAATVSLALSGKPGPSTETRNEIQRIAKKLGYRKDPYSAILAANRRRNIPKTTKSLLAYITSHRTRDAWSTAPNFAIYHDAARTRAAEVGYGLETFWIGRQGVYAKRVSEILYNRGIKGVLLAPLPNHLSGYDMTWERFHTVTLGFSFTNPFLHRVSCDHLQAMRTSVRRCHDLGYRRIGFVVTRGSNDRVDQRWLAAYLLEQQQLADATPLPPLVIDWREDRAFFDWLDREKPDVLLAYAGELFLRKVRESGRRVPEDIGFVSLNLPSTVTRVSGIYENPDRIGRQAVDLLVGGLDRGERGIPDHPNIFLSEPTWIPGETLKNATVARSTRHKPPAAPQNGSKAVSMRDVADLACVHPTTVSLALKQHPRIPTATRERIQDAANKLGYRKNPLITELMRQRRGGHPSRKRPALRFLTAFPTRSKWKVEYPLFSEYYLGARLRARALGFGFESVWLQDPENCGDFCRKLQANNVQGLLIPPFPPNLTDLRLIWEPFCHVSVGFALESPRIHRVATDTYRSMKKAIRESIRRGYRRIGLAVSSRVTHYVQDRWLASFLMQRHEYTDRLIPEYHLLQDGKRDSLQNWLDKENPDLILTPQAEELLDYLDESGYRIPKDIAIVSLDRQTNDRLSGIDQNGRMIGSRAVDLLVGLIENNDYGIPDEPATLLIDGKWHDGRSTREPCTVTGKV